MSGRPDSISIRHLFEAPEVVPELAKWFVEEWGPYYGAEGPGDAEADLRAATGRDGPPICLVAFDPRGEVAGTIALKAESVSHRHLMPWIVAFLVSPSHRGRGIGTALLIALEDEARRLGYRRIYVSTDAGAGIVEKRGGRAFDETETLRGTVKVYSIDL